jgi:hypothetical protein
MKKALVAVLAIYAALFTLGLLGCDNVSSSSDNDGSLFDPKPRGKLEITNIDPSLYGSYQVYICSLDSAVSPWPSYWAKSGALVTNSPATIELKSGDSLWNGTGVFCVYLVQSSIVTAIGQTSFSNGTGTIDYNDFFPVGLTITSIDSSLYGSSVYICSSGNETNPGANSLASANIPSNSSSSIRIYLYSNDSQWIGMSSYYVYLVKGSNQTESLPVTFVNGSASINLSNVTL